MSDIKINLLQEVVEIGLGLYTKRAASPDWVSGLQLFFILWVEGLFIDQPVMHLLVMNY
jgi:hypothetical protein